MKTLEKHFEMNADKSGVHNFTQVRREENVGMYQRNRITDGSLHSYEVFLIKTVKEGASLPGGGKVQEDYEQYPGASFFGRSAWSTNNKRRADQLFDNLLGKKTVVTETPAEETELVTVARVTKAQGERRALKWPGKPFTQKELAEFNGIANYKEVYTDLQRGLSNGTLRVSKQTKEVTRGRAAKMFEVVKAAAVVIAAALI